ncbi:TonB-dependent receptor plug domain-containing protein [Advenella alkanexedens]|uniref:TonB-dependent receptor plug domain-containing protein n=1 Tax=Advenella alkanexedens TaxID=1481665 RepID=UPI0026767275|nr:TonB-dependent receptor plug domain-containing protein [Advenella alkanexedens]WKU19705.1 TonB-dependent receptor plug domain-containing protein [Advenella alkanexedens]
MMKKPWKHKCKPCSGLHLAPLTLAILAGTVHAQQPEPVAMLDTLVVTASGMEQSVKDAPASLTVITQDEIRKNGYTSAAEAISKVEGVYMVGGDANSRDIAIRGLPGEYTLIMVDGKRQNTRETMNRGTGGVQYAFMPPLSAIERIEVVRGPMSSLYGSDAMGGVVNIITKNVPNE